MIELIRHEVKFILPRKLQSPIEDDVSMWLDADSYGLNYPVRSLYFLNDTNMKFRVRTYSNNGSGPVFFEIKGRGELGKFKRRIELDPTKDMQEQIDNLTDGYKPSLLVGYDRQAYVGENDLRVTIDNKIRGAKSDSLFPEHEKWKNIEDLTVMEVKFKDSMPEWIATMIGDYGLRKVAFSKFAKCREHVR